ncbi:hypothetical protein AB0425_17900 [Actinosynnema sp. NPDC051121]
MTESTLAEYVQAAIDARGWNPYRFSQIVGISHDTARRLLAGAVVGSTVLQKIADAMPELPLTELRLRAGLAANAPRQIELPPAFAHMSESNRRLLITLGWRLLESQQARTRHPDGPDDAVTEGDTPTVTALPTRGEPVRRRATRAAHRRSDNTE